VIAPLYIVMALWAALFMGWVLYLAIMNLAPRRDGMHPVVKAHAYALLWFALVYDFLILNVIVGTVLFFELPREWLLTARLKRHHASPVGSRRYAIARWICQNLLNPFDPKGGHC
jgi:hypothetical protein